MNAFPYSTRPQMGTESRSRCRSTNRPHGGRTLLFFVAKKFFSSIVISDWRRPSSCCQVCKLVSSRSRTAAIAIGHKRKPASHIKYDGKRYLDQSITDENTDRSYLSRNVAGENVVVSMTKLSFCYTWWQALQFFPVSCLKSVSQRDTAVSSQKRAKSVLDTRRCQPSCIRRDSPASREMTQMSLF